MSYVLLYILIYKCNYQYNITFTVPSLSLRNSFLFKSDLITINQVLRDGHLLKDNISEYIHF